MGGMISRTGAQLLEEHDIFVPPDDDDDDWVSVGDDNDGDYWV